MPDFVTGGQPTFTKAIRGEIRSHFKVRKTEEENKTSFKQKGYRVFTVDLFPARLTLE